MSDPELSQAFVDELGAMLDGAVRCLRIRLGGGQWIEIDSDGARIVVRCESCGYASAPIEISSVDVIAAIGREFRLHGHLPQ